MYQNHFAEVHCCAAVLLCSCDAAMATTAAVLVCWCRAGVIYGGFHADKEALYGLGDK